MQKRITWLALGMLLMGLIWACAGSRRSLPTSSADQSGQIQLLNSLHLEHPFGSMSNVTTYLVEVEGVKCLIASEASGGIAIQPLPAK